MIRVLLADDHPVFRKGLRGVLEEAADIEVVAELGDGDAAFAAAEMRKPDIAVLDLDMPGKNGIEVARAIRDVRLPVKAVLLTGHKSEVILNNALDAGLAGYLLKDAAVTEILDCIRAVHAGRHYVSGQLADILLKRREQAAALVERNPGLDTLTPTERRVLFFIAEGKTSREIAEVLLISPRTVEHHRGSISEKLGLSGTNALVKFAATHKSQLS
jgi:DNA-binding NarL/FixJ family response regulator